MRFTKRSSIKENIVKFLLDKELDVSKVEKDFAVRIKKDQDGEIAFRMIRDLVKRNKDIAAKIISGGIKEVEVVEDKIILREKRRGKAVKRYKSSGEPGGYRFLEIRKKERGLMMRMIRKVKKFVKHTLKHITMKDTTYKRLVPLVQMDPVSFEKSRKERTNREQSIGRE